MIACMRQHGGVGSAWRSLMARQRCHDGFTLIELLVVFAILAALIAMLLPGLNRARATAKRVECAANQRSLAVAWTEYLDDNNGYFLKGINANIIYGGQQGKGGPQFGCEEFDPKEPDQCISKPLNPYLGIDEVVFEGTEIFRCPVDEGNIRGYPPVAPSYFEFWGTSYETNIYLIGQNNYGVYSRDPCVDPLKDLHARLPNSKRSQVNCPAKVVLMGDAGWVAAYNPRNPMEVQFHGRRRPHLWFNVAFLDTHVDFIAIRKGLYVTPEYSVIPFKDLQSAIQSCQEEGQQ